MFPPRRFSCGLGLCPCRWFLCVHIYIQISREPGRQITSREGVEEVRRKLYEWKRLERFAEEIFARAKVSPADAETVARSLVHADLRGVHSHGLARLPVYVQRVQAGLIDPGTRPEIIRQEGATALLDGKNQLGAVVGDAALRTAGELAKRYGTGIVGVRASNHFGACSYFALQAVEKGQILLVMSNAPATMAPTGGIRPFFGSNPIAVGVPAGEEPPFVLDMATTVAARGQIALAMQKGEAIPPGGAIDEQGEATTDPAKALRGALLPIGGAKGYGLAMFADLFCGLLTGAGHGPGVQSLYDNADHPQNVGHFFWVIDIDRFMPLPVFRQQMDHYLRQIKAEPHATGHEKIWIPGEKEWFLAEQHMKEGIPLPEKVAAELEALGAVLGVDLEEALIR